MQTTKKALAAAAVLTGLAPVPAAADATAMCLDRQDADQTVCACATKALAAEIGADQMALYDAVGGRYLANKAAGQSMGDAWDAAIAETAAGAGVARSDLLRRMNAAGKTHRQAIKACR